PPPTRLPGYLVGAPAAVAVAPPAVLVPLVVVLVVTLVVTVVAVVAVTAQEATAENVRDKHFYSPSSFPGNLFQETPIFPPGAFFHYQRHTQDAGRPEA
ncbi:MAG: hypothetical protein ACRDSM_03475, partial [Pseudonocardiaceae bacterium]